MKIQSMFRILFTGLIVLLLQNSVFGQKCYGPLGLKGKLFLYWGWNRDTYSVSDIHFSGDGYDFTLSDVEARERQSKFNFKKYFGIQHLTIPQYNFRVGYYLNDRLNVSFGIDHMKYVVNQFQDVKINGTISNSNTRFDGVYNGDKINLTKDFLRFEHTDGLNYVNADLRWVGRGIRRKPMKIHFNEGLGFGVLVPRTDCTLLSKPENDEFHLAGYGVSAVFALNLTFVNTFFIQSELKGGFINLPDIRTTQSKADRASQHFVFGQFNIVFGGVFSVKHRSKENDWRIIE